MSPTEPTRAEALAAMTPEKLEEMARPAPRASRPGLRDFLAREMLLTNTSDYPNIAFSIGVSDAVEAIGRNISDRRG